MHKGTWKIYLFILINVTALLIGCCPTPSLYPTSCDDMQCILHKGVVIDRGLENNCVVIPTTVRKALIPAFKPLVVHPLPPQQRFDVAANNMEARAFFMSLVDGTPFNLAINPNVSGPITLNLKHVTLEEALEAVHDVYGFNFKRTPYGFEVSPPELTTQIFNVNYLFVQRHGKSLTQTYSGQITDKVTGFSVGNNITGQSSALSNSQQNLTGASVDTRSEINFWRDLDITLKTMIGVANGRSVVLNPQAGIVIVHAFPAELHRVARFLDRIQNNLDRQVIIEAKILEVDLNDSYQAGIDWHLFGNVDRGEGGIAQQGTKAVLGTDIEPLDGIFTLRIKGNFGALIKMLQRQGNVQVLSSPRISTVNNQKAVIKVGQDEFFVTGVSTSNVVVGASTIPSQDVSLTPFFSGITLDVTPQISRDGSVILHIHPAVSDVKTQKKDIVLGVAPGTDTNNTLTLPLALSTIRESDSIVRARDGQVVVIGGLMQNHTREELAGTPGLMRQPFWGALFRRTEQFSRKSELVILLRPLVVHRYTWGDSVEDAGCSFYKLKRGFHLGGMPETFGNEGECHPV